jgi:hypothetical protein
MTNTELQLLQSLTFEDKIKKSRLRIREWYEHWCDRKAKSPVSEAAEL